MPELIIISLAFTGTALCLLAAWKTWRAGKRAALPQSADTPVAPSDSDERTQLLDPPTELVARHELPAGETEYLPREQLLAAIGVNPPAASQVETEIMPRGPRPNRPPASRPRESRE